MVCGHDNLAIFLNFKSKFIITTMKRFTLIFFSLLSIVLLHAQTIEELAAVRKGNSVYQQAEKVRAEAMQLVEKGGEINTRLANEKFKEAAKLYQDAEISYRKGMAITKNFSKSNYNLANSLYRQEKYEDAGNSFKYIAEQKENDKSLRAKAYHNYGNSLLKQEKFKESIDAYKNALKLQPNDKETKYNLEYARQKMMRQQQQQQQQKSPNDEEIDKILEEAKRLVAQRRYQEAYDLMKEGEKKNPGLKQHADFTNRILDVIKMNP
jgi:tetratricopeptide (TPR) repeat protein